VISSGASNPLTRETTPVSVSVSACSYSNGCEGSENRCNGPTQCAAASVPAKCDEDDASGQPSRAEIHTC
ncbi:hypothetical protein, partial [Salmonella sp. SAL4355]|uniref:hypothetical protein n=1 Tax=Salmonella sp. SAL4355 TaxID=3159876 RepID=UPI0039782831